MSGSDKDDLLGRLLGSVHRGGQPSDETPSAGSPTDQQAGLNPLDLLGLPPDQRDLINWLSRRKQARFDELLDALNTEPACLTAVLNALKSARHIQEALINGEIYYRVVFGGKVSRAARGLPEGIWEQVDLDNTVFLRQIPLFQSLSNDELREIANQLEARQYRRNEVIFWQGGVGEGVYFIKSGIVGTTHLSLDKHATPTLTYLKQGDLLGEYGLLFEQNVAASATATALSEVEVLLMKREDVLDLLKRHPSAAIELIQMLTQRLLALNTQRESKEAVLCLVLGIEPGVGCTTVGSTLAARLAQTTASSVVYTEHPLPGQLPEQFGFAAGVEAHPHPEGYAVFVPQGLSGVPSSVRTTLLMDRLTDDYAHIVVSVTGEIDETVIYMLQRAAQVVVVVAPDQTHWDRLNTLRHRLKAVIRPEKTSLLVVCNRPDPKYRGAQPPQPPDFDIPWFDAFPPLDRRRSAALPPALVETANTLATRLGRTNQIGIYLPVQAEPSPHVEQVTAFLGQRFGRAAGFPLAAVSGNEPVGMAGDKVYLIQTYVTKTDMDHHLGDVLAFVERLKTELGQDVMALEVNHNVMLI
jgi:CRP-like cAMP-binding protein